VQLDDDLSRQWTAAADRVGAAAVSIGVAESGQLMPAGQRTLSARFCKCVDCMLTHHAGCVLGV